MNLWAEIEGFGHKVIAGNGSVPIDRNFAFSNAITGVSFHCCLRPEIALELRYIDITIPDIHQILQQNNSSANLVWTQLYKYSSEFS